MTPVPVTASKLIRNQIVGRVDAFLAASSLRLRPALEHLGNFETSRLRGRFGHMAIDRPVFICGLPRSGSTILLETMARAEGVVTHRYRDFPFPWIPLAWNRFQERFGSTMPTVERTQADGIAVNRDSPEAMEEPLWETFLPHLHDPHRGHVLGAELQLNELERFLREHMRKLLLLRHGDRYVSKGHYNATRIEWLARVFPDAMFVVPVRHPIAQVESLVRCHARFVASGQRDRQASVMLRAAGHYEFGPHRRPVNVAPYGVSFTPQAESEEDRTYYARQWSSVYGYLWSLGQDQVLVGRILFLRYEDLCADPVPALENLFRFCGLPPSDGMASNIAEIQPEWQKTDVGCIREHSGKVASLFGYQWS